MVKVVKKNAPGGKSTKGSNAPGGTPSKSKRRLENKVTRMNINRGKIGEDEKKRLVTQLEMKREGFYVVRDKDGRPKLKKYKDGKYEGGFKKK
tara:strand:+ start:207 stop:485 length:279 start_codon:yes stop_codon:yes gene_type:complete